MGASASLIGPALALVLGAAEPGALAFCGEEGAAVEAFAAALAPVRLEVVPGACAGEARRPRLRLVEAGGVTRVVLERPGEAARARRVPWLEGERGSLRTLAERGRLGSLAVLVHGLLAEREAPAGGELAAPVSGLEQAARTEGAAAGASPRRQLIPGAAAPTPVVEAPGLPEVPDAELEVAVVPPGAPEPDAEGEPEREVAAAPVATGPEAEGEPEREVAAAPVPVATELEGPTATIAREGPLAPSPEHGLEPELLAGVRLRNGSAPAITLVAAAAAGPFAGRLLFESATLLDLEGRPIEHQGAGVGARFVPRLATVGPAALDGSLGADLVVLAVARTDPGSAGHLALEPVAAAGLAARVAVARWLAVVLEAELAASAAPPLVRVPDGPETALGTLGGRFLAGLELR